MARPPMRLGAALLVGALVAVALLPAGCGGKGKPTQPSVTRPYLGLIPNLAANESPGDYPSVFSRVRASGCDFQYVSLNWETFAPSFAVVDTSGLRAQVDGFEALYGFVVYINLATIDTNVDRRPADLRALAWDDPAVMARLDSAVTALIAVLQRPTRRPIIGLAIGNEVDAYLSAHPSERPAYQRLLAHEYARIHAALPGVPVGVSTISPMNSSDPTIGDSLAALGDIVIYTYYPFQNGSDFQHRASTTLDPDFDTMGARAGAKRWALQEIGYSSSPANGSTPAAQADFVTRFRARLARESRDRLLFASWFLYSDFNTALVDQLTGYYGFSTPGFRAYLGNLGLRDTLAVDKPAWAAWVAGP